MKKLKLQMQCSVDGFVAGPTGKLDWMTWTWDQKLLDQVNELTDSVDTILLGREMTDGFITHWSNAFKNPDDPSHSFARKMVEKPKFVFSKTLNDSKWENTTLVKGDLADEIGKLKAQPVQHGKDLIVYGGAGFVSSLVSERLIDDFYLFVNPVIIGTGLSIFNRAEGRQHLTLVNSIAFACGIILLHYVPVKN